MLFMYSWVCWVLRMDIKSFVSVLCAAYVGFAMLWFVADVIGLIVVLLECAV